MCIWVGMCTVSAGRLSVRQRADRGRVEDDDGAAAAVAAVRRSLPLLPPRKAVSSLSRLFFSSLRLPHGCEGRNSEETAKSFPSAFRLHYRISVFHGTVFSLRCSLVVENTSAVVCRACSWKSEMLSLFVLLLIN